MGVMMEKPIAGLIAALVKDKAITLDDRGLPHLPNTGWARECMNVGFNLSGTLNTFTMEYRMGTIIDDGDIKDLRIIARKVGYTVIDEDNGVILFRQYDAWRD